MVSIVPVQLVSLVTHLLSCRFLQGWRYSCYTIGALTLGLFFIRFVVFNFRESPKFLLVKGRDQQAIDVLNSIAKFNKVEGKCLSITLEDLQHIDAVHSQTSSMKSDTPLIVAQPKKWYNLTHLKKLFSTRRAIFLTLLVWGEPICYLTCSRAV